ncbi:LiaI-LiaF-like domain-containing protein [Roseateles sp. PN1]|uniref:LiaI-LiaF-like domain-containing protein n=1 Tax=Roseateles sp. PN1 TaxID=3137372 RepID=UPI003138BD3E
MRSRDSKQQLLFGLVLTLLGLAFLLDNFHIFDVRRILPFWPLVLIALGVFKLSQDSDGRGRGIGFALIAVGSLLTLRHLGVFDFRWRDFWPLILIGAGVFVMARGRLGGAGKAGAEGVELHSEDRIQLSTVLSGNQSKISSQSFVGGKIEVVMGVAQLDLRQASIEGTAQLKIQVVMGSVKLLLPPDWRVSVKGEPVLSEIDDKTTPPLMSSNKQLLIEAELVLGGLELRN